MAPSNKFFEQICLNSNGEGGERGEGEEWVICIECVQKEQRDEGRIFLEENGR